MKLNWTSALAITTVIIGNACGRAFEATDKTLPGLLEKKVPMMLDIYASWCGHCKTLAPIWDELAETYANEKDKVQVVKIDGDSNGKAAKKYDVQYFPTLKFIDADGNVEDIENRDLDSLKKFVQKKTKAGGKTPKEKVSNIVQLTDQNFKELTSDQGKPALVAFTTTWCGHCKRLKPEYEKVADAYVRDDVVIAVVDCTEDAATELAEKHQIQGFPTIMFFDSEGNPHKYSGGRNVESLVDYVNRKADLARDEEGGLNALAGRVPELDKLTSKVVSSKGSKESLDKVKSAAKKAGEKGKLYAKYAEKIGTKGIDYVNKELERLVKLVSSGKITPEKGDELTTKLNVLSSFSEGPKDADDEEQEERDL